MLSRPVHVFYALLVPCFAAARAFRGEPCLRTEAETRAAAGATHACDIAIVNVVLLKRKEHEGRRTLHPCVCSGYARATTRARAVPFEVLRAGDPHASMVQQDRKAPHEVEPRY